MKVIPRNNPFSKLSIARENRIRIVPSRYLPGLVLVVLVSLPGLVSAQPVKFNSPVTYPAGSPFVVSSGDFNRDGRLDLVFFDTSPAHITVLLGKGDGSFHAPTSYPVNGWQVIALRVTVRRV